MITHRSVLEMAVIRSDLQSFFSIQLIHAKVFPHLCDTFQHIPVRSLVRRASNTCDERPQNAMRGTYHPVSYSQRYLHAKEVAHVEMTTEIQMVHGI